MLFDLFKTNEDETLSEYDKRILFKMLTVVFSVAIGMEDELKFMTKEDIAKGKIATIPMHNFDNIPIVQTIKVANKVLNTIDIDAFDNALIPKETIQQAVNYYNQYYEYYLEKEYRTNQELKDIYISGLQSKLDILVKNEEYEKAVTVRNKINILKNTY